MLTRNVFALQKINIIQWYMYICKQATKQHKTKQAQHTLEYLTPFFTHVSLRMVNTHVLRIQNILTKSLREILV